MVSLNIIVGTLNKELKVKSMKDPYSINGLQLRASKDISRIGLAVDGCMDVFEKAKKLNCDLIIVHHGLLQPKQNDTAGLIRRDLEFLKKNKISLYSVHLPLDKHKKYGNNAIILKSLGLEPKELFAGVGYVSYSKNYRSVNSMAKELGKILKTKFKVWNFGKRRVRKIAVVSGYGGGDVAEAIKKKVDLLIIGEASHHAYLMAKEGKINVILGGHYKTETVGVMALGEHLEKKFGLKTIFIDNPTGL